jgi:hypothetical protein
MAEEDLQSLGKNMALAMVEAFTADVGEGATEGLRQAIYKAQSKGATAREMQEALRRGGRQFTEQQAAAKASQATPSAGGPQPPPTKTSATPDKPPGFLTPENTAAMAGILALLATALRMGTGTVGSMGPEAAWADAQQKIAARQASPLERGSDMAGGVGRFFAENTPWGIGVSGFTKWVRGWL